MISQREAFNSGKTGLIFNIFNTLHLECRLATKSFCCDVLMLHYDGHRRPVFLQIFIIILPSKLGLNSRPPELNERVKPNYCFYHIQSCVRDKCQRHGYKVLLHSIGADHASPSCPSRLAELPLCFTSTSLFRNSESLPYFSCIFGIISEKQRTTSLKLSKLPPLASHSATPSFQKSSGGAFSSKPAASVPPGRGSPVKFALERAFPRKLVKSSSPKFKGRPFARAKA